jgi:hypothetical protein
VKEGELQLAAIYFPPKKQTKEKSKTAAAMYGPHKILNSQGPSISIHREHTDNTQRTHKKSHKSVA